MTEPRLTADTEAAERYWSGYGEYGWFIETWRGEPKSENVVVVVSGLTSFQSDALLAELNSLAPPVQFDGDPRG